MRYLGNKDLLINEIINFFESKKLLNNGYVFFDAFCGTGSVANSMKKYYKKIIINDSMKWATLYSYGKIVSGNNSSFGIIEQLQSRYIEKSGFIHDNYSFGPSNRMYFTKENALKIDSFRYTLEKLYKDNFFSEEQYNYIMYRIIESVSDVSNTAGVYGAFLKKWDSRALKSFSLDDKHDPLAFNGCVDVYNDFLENIIEDIECDILYLDPPYTQNQYGTQYHLLETLTLDDNPCISAVTGSRPTGPMRSNWSKEYKAQIALDYVLANTKAKYVVMSYNNDGIMSKKFIESCFKRYGISETYQCKKITYKRYENWKSKNDTEHFEYLFYIELKRKKDVLYESPLNYIGNKYRMCNFIKNNLKSNSAFFDVFGGGLNVGANVTQNKVLYNDINHNVVGLIKALYEEDTYDFIHKVKKVISNYELEPNNSEKYKALRSYYNSLNQDDKKPYILFALIMYGFQQQIRFNSSMEFNNPVGMRWFNDSVLEKLISFCRHIKSKEIIFSSEDFINIQFVDEDCFYYFDPPYLLTLGSYNDGKRGFKGWTLQDEQMLLKKLDLLNKDRKSFMLSYVLEHNGEKNENVINWINKNNYKVIEIPPVLGVSGTRRKEVLILNYE